MQNSLSLSQEISAKFSSKLPLLCGILEIHQTFSSETTWFFAVFWVSEQAASLVRREFVTDRGLLHPLSPRNRQLNTF